MTITASLFEAFLKCPTKCWLRATNEQSSGNVYAEWMKNQNESYRVAETERLRTQMLQADYALSPPVENLKVAKWQLAVDVAMVASDLQRSSRTSAAVDQAGASPTTFAAETRIHAVERVPSEGRGKAAQFIPIRFIFRNKLRRRGPWA